MWLNRPTPPRGEQINFVEIVLCDFFGQTSRNYVKIVLSAFVKVVWGLLEQKPRRFIMESKQKNHF